MTRRLYRAAPRPLRPDTFGVGRGDVQGCDGLGVGVHLEIVDAACDCGRMADLRRLRSVLALGRGAPTHPPWHRSARGLPCDRSRRRFPHNSTISRCTLGVDNRSHLSGRMRYN